MGVVLKLEKRYKKSHNKMILSLKMLVRDEVLFFFCFSTKSFESSNFLETESVPEVE